MRAYFTRKPRSIEDVINNAECAKAKGILPTAVKPIARLKLDLDEYTAFCQDPARNWSFLTTYADESMFHGDRANCVILDCPDMVSLAVCCEGYSYGRYVGCLVSPFDPSILANRIHALLAGFLDETAMPLPSY